MKIKMLLRSFRFYVQCLNKTLNPGPRKFRAVQDFQESHQKTKSMLSSQKQKKYCNRDCQIGIKI